jgi:glycosyltransferase involved in cell wall biosynthesis
VLAGGLKGEDADYFSMLEKKVKDKEYVTLKANVSYEELFDLYRTSEFFWHFAGYGIDEKVHPERVEHLGMTPLEAMAAGAVTFCFGAGGPKEIIVDGKNGFLFHSEEELIRKTESVIADATLYKKIQAEAKHTVKESFTYTIFKTNVINTLLKKS